MSTQEILSQVEFMSLSERMAILEAIVSSIKAEIKDPEEEKKKAAEWQEVLRRRREFKVKAYHLGKDLKVDRDEMYAERGL